MRRAAASDESVTIHQTPGSAPYLNRARRYATGNRSQIAANTAALVVAALFLLALLFSPLAGMVPPYATAPALLFVAGLMLRELGDVHWEDLTEAIPAALCTLAME